MYPISLGFEGAETRISALIKDRHDAETLITSVFTVEKTLRRKLPFCAVCRGITSAQAIIFVDRKWLNELQAVWTCFYHEHRSLPEGIGNARWQHIPSTVTMRNNFLNG